MTYPPFASGKEDYRLSRGMGLWILLVSLLVNCFLLGLIVAPVLHPSGPPPFGPPGAIIDHLAQGLPPADAAALRAAYRQEAPVFETSHRNMEASMQEIQAAIQQPSVDPQALRQALEDIAASHAAFDQAMSRLLTEAAARLSPDGRRILAANGLHPSRMDPPPPR